MSRYTYTERVLSGATGSRRGWFGKYITTVEVLVSTYDATPPMPGTDPVEWKRKSFQGVASEWRDAHAGDFELKVKAR